MNIHQSQTDFLGGQVQPAAHIWSECPKALPIDVRQHQPPSALGGMTWGWLTLDHHQVYITVVRSMFEYVAWAPWLSATITHESPEPTPDSSPLPQLKQSSQNPSCPLFQRVSKPFPKS